MSQSSNQTYKLQKIKKFLRAVEVEMKFPAFLYDLLAKEAETLLLDIYGCYGITLLQYHCAMQLRGDDPQPLYYQEVPASPGSL